MGEGGREGGREREREREREILQNRPNFSTDNAQNIIQGEMFN